MYALEIINKGRFLIYLALIAIYYYLGSYLVTNSDINHVEAWYIPNLSNYSEEITLMIQAILGAIIIIAVFYLGKNHDYNLRFIDRFGEFERIENKFKSKPNNKSKKRN